MDRHTVCWTSEGDLVGIGDKLSELKQKVQQTLSEHPDQAKQGIDKVEHYADERTGGKHSAQIDKAADMLKRHIDEQGQPPR